MAQASAAAKGTSASSYGFIRVVFISDSQCHLRRKLLKILTTEDTEFHGVKTQSNPQQALKTNSSR